MLLHDTPTANTASLIICAPTEEVAHEIRRAMDDAMGVVWLAKKEAEVVAGGGAPQVDIAMHLGTQRLQWWVAENPSPSKPSQKP